MWIRNRIQGTKKIKFSHEKYILCMEFGINHTYKILFECFGIQVYVMILAFFLASGSQYGFGSRSRRTESSMGIHTDPGSTTLLFGKSDLLFSF
jgi:hypothetical protein